MDFDHECVKSTKPVVADGTVHDVREEMHERVSELALSSVSVGAKVIARTVNEEIKIKYKDFLISVLNEEQMRGLVNRVRTNEFHDWESKISQAPLLFVSQVSEKPFLQFNALINIKGKMMKFVGWGHPELIFLTKSGPVNIFIDCTFKIVPVGFTQLMIVMIYCHATKLYLPILYILLQGMFVK